MNAADGGRGTPGAPLRVFVIAGEKSGDELGARLIMALRQQTGGALEITGVGGEAMEGQGLSSLFAFSDIDVMGFLPVIARLPLVLRRIRETADAVVAARPDILVAIDSPDFTHRVARRVKARLPALPVVDYVSPTVWAWRPGRARKMRACFDRVLALLPFEPEAHRRLGGPVCDYVGHPLIERVSALRPSPDEALARESGPPSIVVLPGSRQSEISRLMPVFGETVAEIAREFPDAEFVLPAVTHLESRIRGLVANWPVKPRIVIGEAARFAAFRRARAALAASGTVTLELALSGAPMVVAYKVSAPEAALARRLVTAPSIVLPNLVLGENVIPELIQENCTASGFAAELAPLVRGGARREAQIEAFRRLDGLMMLPGGDTPGARAARMVIETARGRPG